MKTKNILILSAFVSTLLFSCSKDDELSPSEQFAVDIKKIEAYIADNNLQDVQKTESGLHYLISTPGSGANATAGSTVSVHYTGKFLTGGVFDTSEGGNPLVFQLGVGRVILGWDLGLQAFNTGSKGILLIPSSLAYGTSGAGRGSSIGPNEVLLFEVEMIAIN